jgi:hypothetical protein
MEWDVHARRSPEVALFGDGDLPGVVRYHVIDQVSIGKTLSVACR